MMLFRCACCDVEYNPELAIHYCSGVGGVSTGYTVTNSTSGYNTGLCVCSFCGFVYATGTGHICSLRCPLHLSTLPCAWCIRNDQYDLFVNREPIQTITKTDVCEECGECNKWTHTCIEPDWKKDLRPYMSQQEETLADNIDRTLLAKLEGMRAARDEAVRYAQTLNDEAALHRIEDERLRAQATRIIDQVNEGTPVPEDS